MSRSVEEARSLSLAPAVAVETEATFLASRVSICGARKANLLNTHFSVAFKIIIWKAQGVPQ